MGESARLQCAPRPECEGLRQRVIARLRYVRSFVPKVSLTSYARELMRSLAYADYASFSSSQRRLLTRATTELGRAKSFDSCEFRGRAGLVPSECKDTSLLNDQFNSGTRNKKTSRRSLIARGILNLTSSDSIYNDKYAGLTDE